MDVIDIRAIEAMENAGAVQETTVLLRNGLEVTLNSNSLTVNEVTFRPNERTKLHKHSLGQVLYVTRGSGIVGNEDERRLVSEGDVVFFAPDEIHWHGSTKDATTDFSHLSFVLHADSETETTSVVDDYSEQ